MALPKSSFPLNPERTEKKLPLPLVAGLGGLLILLIGGGIVMTLTKGKPLFGPRIGEEEAFYRELEAFDQLLAGTEEIKRPEPFTRALDKLQRKALGVESHLSVLKRRRLLARQDARFIPAYQKAAQEAAAELPSAEALAAVAAEALLFGKPAIDAPTAAGVRAYASRLTETRLKPFALDLYLLLGDLEDPVKAQGIANKETLYSAALPELAGPIPENLDLAVDLLLLQILQGDTAGAAAPINMIAQNPQLTAQHPELLRLGAEFFYDFDTPLRAAEVFAQFSDSHSLARQADALWLSGYVSGARNIWNLLLAPEQPGKAPTNSEIAARSLYNLAATTENLDERRTKMRGFMETAEHKDYYIDGLIAYSRLLDTDQSIALLEDAALEYADFMLDLELLRRYSGVWSLDKSIVETWLLVNRYAEDPRMYQWGCYFFDLQRRYAETAELIRQALHHRQIAGPWMEFHDALRLMREGQTQDAETRLKAIVPPNYTWQIPANIGRIRETAHDPAAALGYYETAASLAKDKKTAAKLLYRMSRCFYALRREPESRAALEQALQFDPDYLIARLELQRANAELP